MSIIKNVLVQARELISNGFCKKQYCEPKDGTRRFGSIFNLDLSPSNTEKYCFCATGALIAATLRDYDLEMQASNLLRKTISNLGKPMSIVDYNDFHTKKEVLALFDITIRELELRELKPTMQSD